MTGEEFLYDRYLLWDAIHASQKGVMVLSLQHTSPHPFQDTASMDALFWPTVRQSREAICIYNYFDRKHQNDTIPLDSKPEYVSIDEAYLGYYTAVHEHLSLRDMLRNMKNGAVQSVTFYPEAQIRTGMNFSGDAEEDAIELADQELFEAT